MLSKPQSTWPAYNIHFQSPSSSCSLSPGLPSTSSGSATFTSRTWKCSGRSIRSFSTHPAVFITSPPPSTLSSTTWWASSTGRPSSPPWPAPHRGRTTTPSSSSPPSTPPPPTWSPPATFTWRTCWTADGAVAPVAPATCAWSQQAGRGRRLGAPRSAPPSTSWRCPRWGPPTSPGWSASATPGTEYFPGWVVKYLVLWIIEPDDCRSSTNSPSLRHIGGLKSIDITFNVVPTTLIVEKEEISTNFWFKAHYLLLHIFHFQWHWYVWRENMVWKPIKMWPKYHIKLRKMRLEIKCNLDADIAFILIKLRHDTKRYYEICNSFQCSLYCRDYILYCRHLVCKIFVLFFLINWIPWEELVNIFERNSLSLISEYIYPNL